MNKLFAIIAICLLGCSSAPVSGEPDGNTSVPPFADVSVQESGSDMNVNGDGGITDSTFPEDYYPDLGTPDFGCCWVFDGSQPDVDASYCNYPDAEMAKIHVTNDISLITSVDVPYNSASFDGGSIDVFGVVSETITNGTLPYDPEGLYFLLPSTEVPVGGFCYFFCGYHESAQMKLGDSGQGLVRYAIVPDFTTCGEATECNPWSVSGVSNVDGMVSVMAHELAEAASDPDPLIMLNTPYFPAWKDTWGSEVGDKCAWNFGDVYIGSASQGSSIYNVEFGSRHWLIQQMWTLDNAQGLVNHCALDLNGNPGFNESDAGFPIVLDSGGGWGPDYFPMQYMGGHVLSDPIHIYYIYYGAWADKDTAKTKDVLKQFANGIGGSDWWKIMTKYYWEPACFGDGEGGLVEAGTDAATEASMNDSSASSLLRLHPPAASFERLPGHRQGS